MSAVLQQKEVVPQSKPMVLHQIFALGYNYDPRGIGYLLFLSLHCNAQLN